MLVVHARGKLRSEEGEETLWGENLRILVNKGTCSFVPQQRALQQRP